MKHLLDVDDFSVDEIESLLERAREFKEQGIQSCSSNVRLASLFYENSTRTSASFDLAAMELGLKRLNFSLANSSLSKGETVEDTTETLIAMGINLIVMRHSSESLIFDLRDKFDGSCSFVNAGSGMYAHPTQALLDLYTLSELGIPFDKLKVALVGDLKHSRVAHSLIKIFDKVGLEQYRLVSPEEFSLSIEASQTKTYNDLREGLAEVDVVIALRVQKERFKTGEELDLETYQETFCLTEPLLRKHCPNAKIMHPGPMNRGIEIESQLADGPRSLILPQVRNGVLIRAAVLDALDF